MIRHIVVFRFKDEFKKEMEKSRKMALALKDKISVIRSLEVGLNVLPQ